MVRASLNLSARVAKSSIYFCEKYRKHVLVYVAIAILESGSTGYIILYTVHNNKLLFLSGTRFIKS